MGKERKKAEKTETREGQTCPMMVCAVKINPRMTTVKPKERIQVIPTRSSSITEKATPACVTSGNIMKIHVNLMPALALVKEPVEEEEEEKDVNSCSTGTENRSKKDPPVTKSVEQTLKTEALHLKKATETKRPGLVLPPKPALESCDHQENKMCFTPRPPITLCEQPTSICSNITPKGCDGGRLWMDNPLLLKSASAESFLPDISLSSLVAPLQTVTQNLVRKRRGTDEGPWGRVRSDHLPVAANEPLQVERNDCCKDQGHHAAATAPSLPGHSLRSHMNLPPPTLVIITMTKKTC